MVQMAWHILVVAETPSDNSRRTRDFIPEQFLLACKRVQGVNVITEVYDAEWNRIDASEKGDPSEQLREFHRKKKIEFVGEEVPPTGSAA